MNKKYYLFKFLEITGICFLVNFVWYGGFVYIANSPTFKSAITENDLISIEIVKYMLLTTFEITFIFSLFLGGLITLMYYAQKEDKKYLKYTIIGIFVIILLLLIYAYINVYFF